MAKRSRRRRSAWGALTQVDDSTWRIRYWAEGADGYRRRSCTVRGSRKDAERRRAELMLEHGDDAPCPTVGQVWERWYLPAMERRVEDGDLSSRTLVQTRSTWRKHVEPRWASVPCDQIKPLHVQQWLDGMTRVPATSSVGLLRLMMDYAVRYGAVDTNPFREKYLMPSKSTVSKQDDGVWTLDELGEVWHAVHGQWFEPAFLLAAFGGLRVGESMGVKGTDVRMTEVDGVPIALVDVRRQVPNRGEVVDKLKTDQSRRTVAIPGRAALRLGELSKANPGYLTHDGMGNANTQVRLVRAWTSAGMAHPFRNLRNSWQTNARWSLRLPPWLVEPMMGHVGEGVTGQHYDRPQAEMFAEVVADAYRERPYDAEWDWLS